MKLDVTPEAAAVLKRSLELAGVDAEGGVRLRHTRALGGGLTVQIEFAEGPGAGDEVVELEGVRFFLDPGLVEAMPAATVALEPQHERVVVRPTEETR